jgi:hypothetical protein
LSHLLDVDVKTLYSPLPRCSACSAAHKFNAIAQPNQEFIVKTQRYIAHRSLPLSGRCAFVRAAVMGSLFGKPQAASTMNEQGIATCHRPTVSLGYEDPMPPGQGGA